jgi:hypothetical protein
LFAIPADCPSSVASALKNSFKQFFANPASAAGQLRLALEQLLTELGVKRFSKTKKGKRVSISLHDRIDLLGKGYPSVHDHLRAAKWLGNAGSHSGGKVSKEDVLDAYELTEFSLNELYMPTARRMRTLARKVNERKGPVKHPRKRGSLDRLKP